MRGRSWIVLVALTLAAVVLAVGWLFYDTWARESVPDGIVVASGRLEGRKVRVSAEAAGRITKLAVEEGDRVEVGQLIAELDRRDEEAAMNGARAALAAAEAGALATRRQIAALEARVELARKEAARYRRLFERDAAPRQAAEQAEAALKSIESELRAARASYALAQRQAEVARARLEAVDVRLTETTVRSPVAGVVTAELARAGETVGPGMPLVEIMVAEDIKLRVYLPLAEATQVRFGSAARVYLDAYPQRFFTGTVERIANEAEFTPKDIHMPDERATLVMAVDIRIPNGDGALKDGFPADAYIRWNPEAPWPERRPW
jgi:HlyD family secretion protein